MGGQSVSWWRPRSGKGTLLLRGTLEVPNAGEVMSPGARHAMTDAERNNIAATISAFVYPCTVAEFTALEKSCAADDRGLKRSKHQAPTEILGYLGLSERIRPRPSKCPGASAAVAIARAVATAAGAARDEPTGQSRPNTAARIPGADLQLVKGQRRDADCDKATGGLPAAWIGRAIVDGPGSSRWLKPDSAFLSY